MIQEFDMEEDEAMLISGHKTRDMLIRYNTRKPGKAAKVGAALEAGFQKLRQRTRDAAEPKAES